MTKGLKQMVEEAMADEQPELPPVQISDNAHRALINYVRQWSGVPDARLELGDPMGSPFASWNSEHKRFIANPETLILNPNRVLLTVTPFRLRQEAVLTGALLHEAGHARFSRWAHNVTHSDGKPVSEAAMTLARTMEEARVEGLIASMENTIGANGLGWTMRAAAAQFVPPTALNMDIDRALMDFITSWALRAGRQYALSQRTEFSMRSWARNFNASLTKVIESHIDGVGALASPTTAAQRCMNLLLDMTVCDDHTGPTMVDSAREVLEILFPGIDDTDQPQSSQGGCSHEQGEQGAQDESAEQDESAKQDEGQPESGDSQDGDESADQGEGGPQAQPEADEAGDGDSEGDSQVSGNDADPEQGEGESEGESSTGSGSGEGEQGDSADTNAEAQGSAGGGATTSTSGAAPEEVDEDSPLAKMLAALEANADADTEEVADEAEATPEMAGGIGSGGGMETGWRMPTKDEREVGHKAGRFLRELISPSETSHVVLTESPSATVDPAAMAAWKAGGQVRDPVFFRRHRREIEPSPPVKIAVLVDVSMSMHILQKPSALLSWAIANAAVDLRNFAGRGQQIESCLIHWGSDAKVIQANGTPLKGIYTDPCDQGTSAMGAALRLAEEQIPGFFDLTDKPVNRLIVQFTDWELAEWSGDNALGECARALEAGVNMLSIVPRGYQDHGRWTALPKMLRMAKIQRGKHSLLRYDPMFPDRVWDHAAASLGR